MNRNGAIDLARAHALAHGQDHAYLPTTDAESAEWFPHAWVVDAIVSAAAPKGAAQAAGEVPSFPTRPPCIQCGAMTEDEATSRCMGRAAGDGCHGTNLWPGHGAVPSTDRNMAGGAPAEPGAEVAMPRPLDDMGRIVFEALGEVSMCWKPLSSGVFESSLAAEIGTRLVEAVRTYGDSRAAAAVAADRAGRRPLTDDQVFACDDLMSVNASIGLQMWRLMLLVRAIERAHGIQAGE